MMKKINMQNIKKLKNLIIKLLYFFIGFFIIVSIAYIKFELYKVIINKLKDIMK
jgi:hypothetical protein